MSVRVKRSYLVSVVSATPADRIAEAIFDLIADAAEGPDVAINPLYGAMVKIEVLNAARQVSS